MKQFLSLIAALMLFAIGATAQIKDSKGYCGGFGRSTGTTYTPYNDTATNSTTVTRTSTIAGAKASLAFQSNITKISGTVSGYIQWQVSVDTGANWTTFQTDTLTNTAGTKAYICVPSRYFNSTSPVQKWRANLVTSGTMVLSQKIWEIWRNDL